jgi:signal transduction histidine kinase
MKQLSYFALLPGVIFVVLLFEAPVSALTEDHSWLPISGETRLGPGRLQRVTSRSFVNTQLRAKQWSNQIHPGTTGLENAWLLLFLPATALACLAAARGRAVARRVVQYQFRARAIDDKDTATVTLKPRKLLAKSSQSEAKKLLASGAVRLPAKLKSQAKVTGSAAYVERMEHLHKLAVTFQSAPDLHRVLSGLLEVTEPMAAVAAITVRLRNRKTGSLDAMACYNLDEQEWKNIAPRGTLGLSKMVLESGKPVMVADVQSHASARHVRLLRKNKLASYFGVPLVIEGNIIGVIGYYSAASHGFSRAEQLELTTLTGLSTVALHNALLREENAIQALDLRRAAVSAEKSDKAKTEFLSVMSHEFRTPLNLIMGYAGMMQEGLLGELSDEQKRSVDRIMQCSDDLLGMIVSILQASSIEAGVVCLEYQDLNPRELIEVLKATCVVPAGKEIELVWHCPDDLPALRTDREKLKQVIELLIDNALKFTDHGRVMVSVAAAKEGAIDFSVADTGIGIAADALPSVFEMFRQSDSSMTRSHGGVGLGLYVAKKFIDLLGGEIRVESQVNRGSIFTVTIPGNS